ncbi:hypothetical protein [Pilimelia anulata]|uniref:hypothetical protein n=1 Tax=Pilimelia anulata TaxID=53371 RepID=UPI001667B998|nr:hypothetical protein [Pilimelia anulata]
MATPAAHRARAAATAATIQPAPARARRGVAGVPAGGSVRSGSGSTGAVGTACHAGSGLDSGPGLGFGSGGRAG